MTSRSLPAVVGAGLILLAATASTGKELIVPVPEEILKTLKPTHPRLMIDDDTIPRIKALIRAEPMAARWYADIKSDADRILGQLPSKYEIPDGKRLLGVSRRVKERVRTLAFVYLMEGERRYVDRVWTEISAAAAFKDWNPSHFLDTAEMTHAFALAYDWLHDEWTDEQRGAMREAIVAKGLNPAMKVYEDNGWWAAGWNNWNQVCNGGIGVGALAIAEDEPQLCAKIVHYAVNSIPRPMGHYAPDGAGTEGVTYWDYGARYNVIFLASLETALGTDFGLAQVDGFAQSGTYQMYMAGAERMSFNFADCGLRRMSTAMHFWMGRKFGRPEYGWYRFSELEHPGRNGGVLDLLWYDDSGRDFDASTLALDKHYRVAECASMRSAWDDADALVVGIQAGDNRNLGGHRHLDLGSFILDALGERWIMDLGSEGQTYQRHKHGNPKWKYYRIRAEGHNTLVINPAEGPDQEPRAKAEIVTFESTDDRAVAVINLTEAYSAHASRVQRTISMIDRSHVTIADEGEMKAPAEVWWFAHTGAEVELSDDKATATLAQGGKELRARLVEPEGTGFVVMDAEPLPTSPQLTRQASNKGRRTLAIHLTDVTKLRVTVRFDPS
ncbi:MAG: heparinase II/III family protein [Armatimonadota bacterium]|jgi:hypothetical protein